MEKNEIKLRIFDILMEQSEIQRKAQALEQEKNKLLAELKQAETK